jgi:hypothetical protein
MRDRFVVAVLAREEVTHVARILGKRDIPIMPLKGALLQQIAYADPVERAISDVDILVPLWAYGQARDALLEAGYVSRPETRTSVEEALEAPSGLMVDLHRGLFSLGRYRMSTSDVFARGENDETLFGAPIVRMADVDIYVHLLGKFASDHSNDVEGWRLRELGMLPTALRLEASPVAAHIERCGIGRAARYVLPLVSRETGDRFSREVVELLSSDRLGDVVSTVASVVLPRIRQTSPLGAVVAHTLNHSLRAATWSVTSAAFDKARRRLLARGRV